MPPVAVGDAINALTCASCLVLILATKSIDGYSHTRPRHLTRRASECYNTLRIKGQGCAGVSASNRDKGAASRKPRAVQTIRRNFLTDDSAISELSTGCLQGTVQRSRARTPPSIQVLFDGCRIRSFVGVNSRRSCRRVLRRHILTASNLISHHKGTSLL